MSLETKPDDKPNASPLSCKFFSATLPDCSQSKLFLLCFFFFLFAYHHICARSRTSDMLAIAALHIVYPQSTFPQILGPRLQLSTGNMKRGSACAVRQQNIQAGLTLMAPPFTRDMIFSFLLLRSGHEVESVQVPGLVLASRQQTTSTSCAATQRRCPLCS